jgi:heptosyltransferase I
MVPVVRTLQQVRPDCRLTWIIGRREAELVDDLPGIEFIRFDKQDGLRSYRKLARELKGRRFDVLFHMQNSWRANSVSLALRAAVRIGFARGDTHDAQWLFTNHRIPPLGHVHVMESFFAFLRELGIAETSLTWDLPIPATALEQARQWIPDGVPALVVSPCAAPRFRNFRDWPADRYATVCRYAADRYGLKIIITGGASKQEAHYSEIIRHHVPQAIDLTGKTRLKDLLALLTRARGLLCPDSGPAHMGTAAGIPVIGLFASTNPDRARPYRSRTWCVNRYPDALERFLRRHVDEVPWGTRVRDPGAMDLVTVGDVMERLDRLMAGPARSSEVPMT